jgi:hypothetical protein
MQTAEKRRLTRMGKYATWPPARSPYAPEGGAIEGNDADDALLVIRPAKMLALVHQNDYVVGLVGTVSQVICNVMR